MTEAKPPKLALAEQRIEFLKSYMTVIEAFQDRLVVDPRGDGDIAKGFADRIDVDRPELLRVAREVGVGMPAPPDRGHKTMQAIKVAIREWERAGTTANERISTLRAYLTEVRRLEVLEIAVDRATELAQNGMALSDVRRVLVEDRPKVTDLKDRLGEEQHEIERILNDVGRSIDEFPLARGAHGIVEYVATEVAAAIGAYRHWPTSKARHVPGPPPNGTPAGGGATININNTANSSAHVAVANVLEQLTRAVEQAAPEEKKSLWRDTLKEIAGSAAGAGVKAALEKLLGPGGA